MVVMSQQESLSSDGLFFGVYVRVVSLIFAR